MYIYIYIILCTYIYVYIYIYRVHPIYQPYTYSLALKESRPSRVKIPILFKFFTVCTCRFCEGICPSLIPSWSRLPCDIPAL